MADNVNHPAHYNQGGIECIDAMISAFGNASVMDFCALNAFKYIFRHKQKGGLEDMKKAAWYIGKYLELGAEGSLNSEGGLRGNGHEG